MPDLIIEFINGPFDGYRVVLSHDTEWVKEGDSPLAFPWDNDLGMPQARFYQKDGEWFIDNMPNNIHGTYCLDNNNIQKSTKIQEKFLLGAGMVLRASKTWLRIGNFTKK